MEILDDKEFVEIPTFCKCPITGEIMEDPVIVISGHSYERKAILKWLEKGNNKDPLTGIALSVNTIYTNYNLRDAIEHVRDSLPDYQRNAENLHRESLAVSRMEEIVRGKKDALENEFDNYLKEHFRVLDNKNKEIELIKKKFQETISYYKKVIDGMYKLYNELSKKNINKVNKFIICRIDNVNFNNSDSGILASSSDNKINLWNVNSEKCLSTLHGHTKPIRTIIKLNSNLIASGSEDTLIKIWNIGLAKCVGTLYGHMATVFTIIKMNDKCLISGSEDMHINVWRADRNYFIKAHTNTVRTLLKFDEKTFISGSSDNTIKIWSYETRLNIKTLIDHTDCVYSLIRIDLNTIASGSSDKTIKIWNVSLGKCEKTLTIKDNKIKSLVKINAFTIVSTSMDGRIYLWNINSGMLIKTLNSYSCCVLSDMKINDSTIAFVSANQTIRILNIGTGICKSIISDQIGDVSTLSYLN